MLLHAMAPRRKRDHGVQATLNEIVGGAARKILVGNRLERCDLRSLVKHERPLRDV